MIVASNGEQEVVEETIKAAGLDHIFPKSKIFTKNMVAHPKPAPDLFLFAQRKAGCKNDYTVVLEDSVTGVKAGKAASMRVIGITAFSENPAEQSISLKQAGADFIIPDITGLEAMITHKTTRDRQLRTDFTKQA
jgi:beta-phosphoglucomutase-like phosphatase (HAD superfamily)